MHDVEDYIHLNVDVDLSSAFLIMKIPKCYQGNLKNGRQSGTKYFVDYDVDERNKLVLVKYKDDIEINLDKDDCDDLEIGSSNVDASNGATPYTGTSSTNKEEEISATNIFGTNEENKDEG